MNAKAAPQFESGEGILVSTGRENRLASFSSLVNEDEPDTIVTVSYEKPIDQWLSGYRAVSNGLPKTTVGIGVGETLRAAAAENNSGGTDPQRLGDGILIDAVESADDIAELGIKFNEYVEDYVKTGDDSSSTVVCFDSVSALIDQVGVDRAFRFLHIFLTCARNADATVYAFLDPDEDLHVRSSIQPLFDAYVDTTVSVDSAEWTVETPY